MMTPIRATVFLLIVASLLAIMIALQWPDRYLHLILCDVGQGDAILVSAGFTQVLIDAGKDERVLECLAKNLPFWDRTIELVVATHADSDHIGGFPAVGERYHFSYLLTEPLGRETEVFQGFSELVSRKQRQGTTIIFPRAGEVIRVADTFTFKILSPRETSYLETTSSDTFTETQLWDAWVEAKSSIETSNDRSIVLLGKYKEVDFLLTGDLEELGEQALVDQGVLPDIEILKVGHHGSKTSTTTEFLRSLRPEIAVNSSGQNNQYGHPAPGIMKKIEESGAKILRTDQEGEIHLVSDGEHIWLLKCVSLLCHTF